MRTYDARFPRYTLGNGLMFFCRVFSPAVGRGSSALSTFLDRRTQRVKNDIVSLDSGCSSLVDSIKQSCCCFLLSAFCFLLVVLKSKLMYEIVQTEFITQKSIVKSIAQHSNFIWSDAVNRQDKILSMSFSH